AQLGAYGVVLPGRTRAAIRDARVRFGIKVGNPKRISPERQAAAAAQSARIAENRRQAAERRAASEKLRADRAQQREAARRQR
ncbi:hypothetical protein JVW08_20125, partial [Vibrio cholerae O1]|uniref:hypothetical protein n=1 Tax=Vibrio cholerae TaxID=666 RepID=UPI001C11802D